MKRAAIAALACLYAVASAQAQNLSADDLNNRLIHRRAVEAIIWGMPAVNYDLMLQAMLNKTEGKVNEFIYWSRPPDWKNQTLTPNPDAIYFMSFFNTKDTGPVVIEVPPAEGGSLAANIDDIWQTALEDAGPEGADQGKGGKYLILPPDYNGNPPAGYFVLRSQTYGGFALFRSNLTGRTEADFVKSVAYAKRLKIYPLAQAANPRPTTFTDVREILYDRCEGDFVRLNHSFRPALLSVARPYRAERALAGTRQGDDRSTAVDRNREGQALQRRRQNARNSRRRRSRGESPA
jgi:hypothetical protein